ncbi:MAG: hypothetical protein WC055_02235 [Melioribacteraceae bacterium]
MSINKLISVRNPIIDAQDFLGIDHDKDVPWFTRLATLAEQQIGSYYQYERKRKVINISNCVACLPNDAVLVEAAILGDLGEDCDNLFASACGGVGSNSVTNVNSNGLFLVVDLSPSPDSSISFGKVDYSIQNNKIIFDRSRDGQKVTVQYIRYKTDCDGFIEVGENHVNAIRWYIIYHYLFRKSGSNYIERDKMNIAFQEWNRECRHARAEDNRLTESQYREVARAYNNPMSGRGLWQGMYTTLGNFYTIW